MESACSICQQAEVLLGVICLLALNKRRHKRPPAVVHANQLTRLCSNQTRGGIALLLQKEQSGGRFEIPACVTILTTGSQNPISPTGQFNTVNTTPIEAILA